LRFGGGGASAGIRVDGGFNLLLDDDLLCRRHRLLGEIDIDHLRADLLLDNLRLRRCNGGFGLDRRWGGGVLGRGSGMDGGGGFLAGRAGAGGAASGSGSGPGSAEAAGGGGAFGGGVSGRSLGRGGSGGGGGGATRGSLERGGSGASLRRTCSLSRQYPGECRQ